MPPMRLLKRVMPAAFLIFTGCATLQNPISALVQGRQATVFVFLAPDCPLSQNYVPTLNQLRTEFQNSDIEFYAVFAGQHSVHGAGAFVNAYGIQLPVLEDEDYKVTDFLNATTTPEAFVVDGAGRTLYVGAIDNRAPELGQRRTVITEQYLLQALESVIRKDDVRTPKTRPVGCFIERATS